ncbi:hypothetical protein HFN89_01550 [Rhizobium laguerreae]|nr:hypothetical protein [Rhizobium laguerreae]
MEISEIEERFSRIPGSEGELNEMLFAKAFGWSYPLTGAGYHHFHDLSRDHGKTDFTGNAHAAFTLARQVIEKAKFEIAIAESGRAEVRMSGYSETWQRCFYDVARTGPTLALAVSSCALEVMKRMSQNAETMRMAG